MSSDQEGTTATSPEALDLRDDAPQEHAVQLLEGFLGLMPDAALVIDGDGQIISANGQAEVLFGYDPGELIGRVVETLVPERYRHQHRRDRATYLQQPRARPMGAGLELSGRRRDGTEFPVDISLAPLTGLERPLAVAAVRDASERRAASAAQAQLAAIVQSSSDAIVSMSVEGSITSWNRGAEHVFGYASSEVVGHHISLLVPGDASEELEELLGAVVGGETPAVRDTQWLRRDGSRLDVALSLSPLVDPGGRTLGFSAVVRDATARKHAETELRRVLADERRRKRQQEATAELRLALLSATPLHDVLGLVCERACGLLDAQAARIVLVEEGDEGQLIVEAAFGGAASVVGTRIRPGASLAGRAIAAGDSQVVPCLAEEPGIDPEVGSMVPAGPAIGVPFASEAGVQAALVVTRSRGASVFVADDVAFASAIAAQAGLAIALSRARADREELVLSRDRDRIARDLHDLVIQRLFAAGLGLQGVAQLSPDPQVATRVNKAVDDLDATIREIRNTIFALESGAGASGLRAELLRLTAGAGEGLGFDPIVRFDGPVDARVPSDVVPQVLAVVREALSNATRHAHASRVDLDVRVDDHLLVLVTDDGVGLGEGTRRSGLANLRRRAEALGGTLVVSSPPEGGTRLSWKVPLEH